MPPVSDFLQKTHILLFHHLPKMSSCYESIWSNCLWKHPHRHMQRCAPLIQASCILLFLPFLPQALKFMYSAILGQDYPGVFFSTSRISLGSVPEGQRPGLLPQALPFPSLNFLKDTWLCWSKPNPGISS
jgi:hypothetical protein